MGGMHTGDKLSGIDAAKVERAIETFVAELGDYLDGSQMRVPHDSHVILAGS